MQGVDFIRFQRERVTAAVQAIADLAAVRGAYDALGGNSADASIDLYYKANPDAVPSRNDVINCITTCDKLLAALRGESASIVNGDHTNLFRVVSTF